MNAVVFDLDGTLVDTVTGIEVLMNRVLKEENLKTFSKEDYRHFIGGGSSNLVHKTLTPEHSHLHPKLLPKYINLMEKEGHTHSDLFPGIADLLDILVNNNIKISILTNKPHSALLPIVDNNLKPWKFNMVLGQKVGEPIKPNPQGALSIAKELGVEPKNCFFVGDSDVDMITASRSGMRAIGVSWGYRPPSLLLEHKAEAILQHPLDLVHFILEGDKQ